MTQLLLRRALPVCAALLVSLGAHAQQKTLTVCTQDSPEGFDIAQYTGAVTADATS